MTVQFNLLILHTPDRQDISDWTRIARFIQAQAPDIEVRIANNFARGAVTRRWQGRRPSVVFSPYRLADYEPSGGRIYTGRQIPKLEQVERFRAAGVRTPHTAELTADLRVDLPEWSDRLILKPMQGFYGKGVSLVELHEFAARKGEFLARGGRWLVQDFVDTGEQPYQYRVLTMFGRPLYAITLHAALKSQPEQPSAPGGNYRLASNVAETAKLSCEADVLEFASRMHAALKEVPVLGIDILRDRHTGQLYALEANPGGNVWHLSSPAGKQLQQATGINLYEQFGALEIAAEELIVRTRNEATY